MALVDKALAHLASDVGLRPADQPRRGDARLGPIGGMGCRPQQFDLFRVLHLAQWADDLRREVEAHAGHGCLEAQQEHGVQEVGNQQRRAGHVAAGGKRVDHESGRVLHFPPSHEVDVPRPDARGRVRCAHLQPRHDQRRSPGRLEHEEGEPLERHRRVPDQPAQVRPDADQQRTRPASPERILGTPQSFLVTRGRDGRDGRTGHLSPPSCCSHASTSRWPSVKNLLYENTLAAPAASARRRVSRSSCWATAMAGRPAVVARSMAAIPS